MIDPAGAMRRSAPMPAASRRIRSGGLNQSSATRNFSSACFKTHFSPLAGPPGPSGWKPLPPSRRTAGSSSGPIRPLDAQVVQQFRNVLYVHAALPLPL